MNRDALTKVLIFAVGAGIGSSVTWYIAKTKYEKIANEEIQSVKEHYKNKESGERLVEGLIDGIEEVEADIEKADLGKDVRESLGIQSPGEEYKSYTKKYLSSQNEKPKHKEEEEEDVEKPYVISPDEFGEMDGYETESLTLYSDKVLADDFGAIIDDVDGIVGRDSLNRFGEYEEDTVFVRNDARKCDYEILADSMTYKEAYPE